MIALWFLYVGFVYNNDNKITTLALSLQDVKDYPEGNLFNVEDFDNFEVALKKNKTGNNFRTIPYRCMNPEHKRVTSSKEKATCVVNSSGLIIGRCSAAKFVICKN